ncbi:hypothetical protein WME97_41340 [Sorangium sp. So ce367]|uniref:hypothetical protein n=1 Tax=Sorangium sp. So ce367 TaxID=3133305 RepID=UPI003F5EFC21
MRSASEEDLLNTIRKIVRQSQDATDPWISTEKESWEPGRAQSNDRALHEQFLVLLQDELRASKDINKDISKRVATVESVASSAERIAIEALVAAKGGVRDAALGYPNRLHELIAAAIRGRAPKISGVTAAYLSPDGTSFVITGPEWTEELSEAGATLASELQGVYAPHGDPYIDGSFVEGEGRPEELWIKVFP